ncbi:hypothetical protein [Cupriavidus oxalaticus]|uniref:TraD/TraG TraM recognition site domain-containing protein n=1 Tax=Cupriavidus oxalaticus TaxID=96344 RepID=A0A4P7LIQ5_9BURK|nr:hypothetical protein [Cupriavidus oxalaticus]QBY56046.1 hypothetical protein E0W60_33875 [Cupriavidus oxalaticus]
MNNPYQTAPNRELSQQGITLDPRPIAQKIGDWLKQPRNYAKFQLGAAVASIALSFLWLPITVVMLLTQLWYSWQRFQLPMRMPKHLGGIDPTLEAAEPNKDGTGEVIKRKEADGILHLGNQRSVDQAEHLKELWVTNSDARTHMLLMGTTGSGKTVTLLSICFNALAWGSGFFYSDGKADSSLHAAVWSMCRRTGREDDYLVLNFMTGGADPYKRKKSTEKHSNSMNPWYEGTPDFLSQLSSSLLPKAGGDGAQWQQKAVNMMDAVLRTLCYERAVGNLTLSIGVIREYLALPNLVKLYLKGKKGEIPEYAFLPIKAYLETGLPGFRPDLADKPDKWDQGVYDQHGYLTGQYARTLSMLMDTYGYIFKDKYSEVDMMDVLLNRRILVVMIPTLEKSAQEAANLGKLVVASIRLMMAMNLGHRLEGTYAEIIDTKATNSPAPYIITMDELGYYFAEGIALMFAQARSLGFMMIAAGQDVAAMAKGENKEEVDSMIANTKIKYTLALEDPDKTLEVFKKVAGQAITVETGSYEGSVGNLFPTNFNQALTGSIQRRDRIELQELKALKEMEGILIFKDQVTRARSFTWFHSFKKTKLPFRLNRFLQVDRPQFFELKGKVKPIKATDRRFTTIAHILQKIREGTAKKYPANDDPIVAAVRETWLRIEDANPNEGAVNRGIAYYQAAVAALRAHQPDEQGRYWKATGGEEEQAPEPSAIEQYEGVDFAAEAPAIVPAAPNQEAAVRTEPYHNPPLQEKAASNAFAELVREFAESTQRPASVLSSIKEKTVSATVPDDYDTLPEAQAASAQVRGAEGGSSPASSASDSSDGGLNEWLAQYQDSPQADGDTSSERTMEREHNLTPAQVDLVNPEPPQRTAHQVETNPVVIGFTQEAADMLVRMEEALGSEQPQEAVKATESEISAQLKWSQPAEDMSIEDIEQLFGSMQANIEKSANKAR